MKIRILLRALKFVWYEGKLWIIFSVLFSVIIGLIPVATIQVTEKLVNSVARLIQQPSSGYYLALLFLILQFTIMLLDAVVQNLQDYLDNKMQIKMNHDLKKIISTKTSTVPFAYFDIPKFYNHLNRVQGSPGNRFLAPIKDIFAVGSGFISIVSLIFYLFTVHWSLGVLSLLAGIPTFFIRSFFGSQKFWLLITQTPLAREAQYLEHLLNDRQAAKEIRLFNLPFLLLKRWSEKFMKNSNESLALLKKEKMAEVSLDGLTALFYAGASGIIIWLIKTTTIKIGAFVAIGQAVHGTQNGINEISTNSAKLYEDSLYIADFFEFIDFDDATIKKLEGNKRFPNLMSRGISFRHVSFRYPLNEEYILKDVSFIISPGEKVAIVGENGSGKTTLIKCLLGLYVPEKGRILFEDININEIDKDDLRKNVTVIFQDFMKYSLPVRENIAFGDIHNIENLDRIKDVARRSGVANFVENFQNTYDTYLGRFLRDGVDLSGGQWQKIALSRALFREGRIFALDEPTAALDPQSELEVFSKFKELTNNKTSIFISHRMAAAKMADRIIVMKEGKVVENGSHEKLIKLNGEYARMFTAQAQWYSDTKNEKEEAVGWMN